MPSIFNRLPQNWIVLFAFCLLAALAEPEPTAAQQATITQPAIQISQPHTQDNLSVYVITSDNGDDREFITLNEGLKSGMVTVTELKSETVNTLQIQNKSDLPLFLQEGDRVTGGKQDRTIYSSMVVEANSKPQNIPTFCIEQSRWAMGSLGKNFKFNQNVCYASNAVRSAAKIAKNQSHVWNEVAKSKSALQQTIGTSNFSSSLHEAIDSKKVVESTNRFKETLGELIAKNSQAVGFAFAINGQVKEINVFPSHKLAAKVFPRMLETYALDAVANKPAADAKPPTAASVQTMMKTKAEQVQREEQIDSRNKLLILTADKKATGPKVYQCETSFKGELIHQQWLLADIDQKANQSRNQFSGNMLQMDDPFGWPQEPPVAQQQQQQQQQLNRGNKR